MGPSHVLHMPPPPPPPPLQRCCCSKNTLALNGAALAGVAVPKRTDHAITANNIVLMAVAPHKNASTPPKRLETRTATEIGSRARSALVMSLRWRLDMRISASLPISAQTLHLGVFRRCCPQQAAGSCRPGGMCPPKRSTMHSSRQPLALATPQVPQSARPEGGRMGLAPDGRRTPTRLYNWREDRSQ